MTTERIFLGYMVLVGAATGAILVAAPQVYDFAIQPYLWILIATGLFDGGIYLLARGAPWTMLPMGVRLFGFVIGLVLMVAIPTLAGAPVRFL